MQMPEQKQGHTQKQITTHPCTEKQMLQHSTKCQVQNKPSNQARRKRKSRKKKSRRIIQHWARQGKQKELEWESHHQKTYDNQINQQTSSFNQLMIRNSASLKIHKNQDGKMCNKSSYKCQQNTTSTTQTTSRYITYANQ